MVSRLAKGVLPANTILGKDALLALHKSATVFVNYIASKYVSTFLQTYGATGEALRGTAHHVRLPLLWTTSLMIPCTDSERYSSNELAQSSGKKTIQPQDVMSCIKDAELEHFLPRLEAELQSTCTEPFMYCRSTCIIV